MKLVIFSIVQNEAETIAEVIDLMPNEIEGIDEIVKVIWDDGSDDDTVGIAKEKGVLVFQNGAKKRLAYSFQKAVAKALELGADIMVNIDGDLQFNPKQIPLLVEKIVSGEADFVAADRFTNQETGQRERPENMPVGKYYGNQLGAKIVSKLTGYEFNDVTCGFRAYNRDALLAININSKYTYTQESFQILASKKYKIASQPVDIKYYPGRKSRVVTNFMKFLFGSALNIIKAFRDSAPLAFFTVLSALFLAPGIVSGIGILVFWLINNTFTPYKFVGFFSIYMISLSIITFLLGLVADMLDRSHNNQEKILRLLKEQKYKK